jgi:hypothetical protein
MRSRTVEEEAVAAAQRGMKVLINHLESDAQKNPGCSWGEVYPELEAVARAYEEAQRRAQMEATR